MRTTLLRFSFFMMLCAGSGGPCVYGAAVDQGVSAEETRQDCRACPPPADGPNRQMPGSYASWREMSAGQRSHLRGHWRKFKNLPPEKRAALRKNYDRWKQMPDTRRRMLREKYRQWRKLSPDERDRLREKYRRQSRCGCKPFAMFDV